MAGRDGNNDSELGGGSDGVGIGLPYVLHLHNRPPISISRYSIDYVGNLTAWVGEEVKEFGWREWRWVILPMDREAAF